MGVGGVTGDSAGIPTEQVLQSVVTTAGRPLFVSAISSPAPIWWRRPTHRVTPGTTTNRMTVIVGDVYGFGPRAGDETSTAANFGVLQQESVSGVVFNDTNGNGRQDSGEMGVGGALITLERGTPVSSLNTAGGRHLRLLQS